MRIYFALLAVLAFPSLRGFAQGERTFTLGGAAISLRDSSGDAEIYYRSMRFNRALQAWNVEVIIRNKSPNALAGPLIYLVDATTNTSGMLDPDGLLEAKSFFDLSAFVPNGALGPGESSLPRTLALGASASAPSLGAQVFSRPPSRIPLATASGRTLDEVGQPLPAVEVEEVGPGGQRAYFTDPQFGVVTLGQAPGQHAWRFSATNYLPVWRKLTLQSNEVSLLANPRLVPRSTNTVEITPIAGGQLADAAQRIRVRFAPGAFAAPAIGTLTALSPQTLPAFLPPGWSPLQTFWLELTREPAEPGSGALGPFGVIFPNETAALARWNSAAFQWDVLQLVAADGTNAVAVVIPGSGAYALVVPDLAPTTPPPAEIGQSLQGSPLASPATQLTASGRVTPSSSPAARVPELVTGIAEVSVTNAGGAMPSGLLLHGDVSEAYLLGDGSRRVTPQYEMPLVGYQRPGDNDPATLAAQFPVRPLLLLGSDELIEAGIRVTVLAPPQFSGGLIETNGGQVSSGGVSILAGDGDVPRAQAAVLRTLDPTNFFGTWLGGSALMQAFELSIGEVGAGRRLALRLGPQATNSLLVLARSFYRAGLFGLEPVERLVSDAAGRLASAEPPTGERLPGITSAGQYLLLRVNSAQGLITGTARDTQNNPTAGLAARVGPWLTFSASDGAYRLLAPTGAVDLTLTDLRSGDVGRTTEFINDAATPIIANISLAATAPRVISVSPESDATAVSRVTPIVITFSEPIDPRTLASDGVQLFAPAGAVQARLSLNLQNTVATLLPNDPLAAGTPHTVRVSTNISDLAGLRLEGSDAFSFTTATQIIRGPGAQVISYEPTNGVARMEGTQGIADPESPVILVNETSGKTSTVLSKPDGGFSNSIEATVDDFLSAVFVNQNGTRTTIPVSRQIFADGRVGLFQAGGAITNETPLGPVTLTIAPGAIPNKTIIRLEAVSETSVLSLASNAPPTNAVLLSGISINASGDELTSPATISLPLDPAALPANVLPEALVFVLVRTSIVGGVLGYEYLSQLRYEPGQPSATLQASSPGPLRASANRGASLVGTVTAFAGEFFNLFMNFEFITRPEMVEVIGKVQSARLDPASVTPVPGSERPLAGGVVTVLDPSVPINERRAGDLFAVSDRTGEYGFFARNINFMGGGMVLRAIHPSFPNIELRSAPLAVAPGQSAISGQDFTFLIHASIPDITPPTVFAAHDATRTGVGQTTAVRISATDAQSPPALVNVTVHAVLGTNTSRADATLIPQSGDLWELTCVKEAVVVLRITATDASRNSTDQLYPVQFSGVAPGPDPTFPRNTNDLRGPFVVATRPAAGTLGVLPGTPIVIRFNEPIHRRTLLSLSAFVSLTPPAGTPIASLEENQRELVLVYPRLEPDTGYTLTILGLRDVSDNRFDQNPATTNFNESFSLSFNTAPQFHGNLAGMVNGGGAIIRGIYAFVLEREGPLDGSLAVYDLEDPQNPRRIIDYDLPDYPRDLVMMPRYSFALPNDPPERRDLIAVAGGRVQGEGGSQYLAILSASHVGSLLTGPPLLLIELARDRVSFDGTAAISKLAWNPPNLAFIENKADFAVVQLLELQRFLYGRHLNEDAIAQLPLLADPGLDGNNDGDFVDPGDRLPIPSITDFEPLRYPGLVDTFTLERFQRNPSLTGSSRFINDIALTGGGEFLGTVVGGGIDMVVERTQTNRVPVGPMYRSYVHGQDFDGDQTSASLPGANSMRLVVTEDIPWRPPGGGSLPLRLALITSIGAGFDSSKLSILDVSAPTAPTLLNEITIPFNEVGLLRGITRDEDGRIILATETNFLVLDSELLAMPMPSQGWHPSIANIVAGGASGGTTFSVSRSGLAAASLRGRNVITFTGPTMRLVASDSTNVFDAFALVGNEPMIARIRRLPPAGSLNVAQYRGSTNTLIPPHGHVHYYVLIDAPGSAGQTIDLALESIDAKGRAVLGPAAGPPTQSSRITARRLSDDLFSPDCNLYLSRPIAVVNEPLFGSDLAAINASLNRAILFAGHSLRAAFATNMGANPVLKDYATTAGAGTAQPGVFTHRPTQIPPQISAPPSLRIKTTVDRLNNYSCAGSATLKFEVNVESLVTLKIDGNPIRNALDLDSGAQIPVFTNIPFAAGTGMILLDAGHVGDPGQHTFILEATALPYHPNLTISATGQVFHAVEINHSFPIGHTVINGVDLWDGHLTHSRQDVVIPGRRLSLDFTRTYSSSGDSADGPLGAGWTHSYNIRLVESCGRFVVIGGEGSGNAFRDPTNSPTLATRYAPLLAGRPGNREFFTPQLGYHSVLVRYPDDTTQLDFFTKAGIRYHFVLHPDFTTAPGRVFTLREIREPNGNRLVLEYLAGDGDVTTLDSVSEIEGGPPGVQKRALVLEYQRIFQSKRITRLTGFNHVASGNLLGLEILYHYDDVGNLTNVVRRSTNPGAGFNDERSESYIYTPGDLSIGHNLLAYIDPNGSVTEYEYHDATSALPGFITWASGAPGIHEAELIKSSTRGGDPALNEDIVTRFEYDFVPRMLGNRLVAGTRTVSDARENEGVPPTVYVMNIYGATVRIEAPLGQITEMEWATDVVGPNVRDASGQPVPDVLMIRKTDAEGRIDEYEYTDGRGNLTKETIRFAPGKAAVTTSDGVTSVNEISTSHAYDPLFNQRVSMTDAENHTTTYTINAQNGNLEAVTDAEGNISRYFYRANGDLERREDPRGAQFTTRYLRYDDYGNVKELQDSVGNISLNTFDERSRLREATDTFGHRLVRGYDSLDRNVQEERLNDLSGLPTGPAQTNILRYLANGELAMTVNGLGHVTRHLYDRLNRRTNTVEENVIQVIGAAVTYTSSVRYDQGSNPILEMDARGISKANRYDHLNRRVRTELVGGPSTPSNLALFGGGYDRVNNLIVETNLHGFATTYIHDGLYRVAEALLPFGGAVVSNRYDRMGNKVVQTDANRNAAILAYDRIYRLLRTTDADGNSVTNAYDTAGNKILEHDLSSGLITEFLDIDGLNRPGRIRKTVPLAGPSLATAIYETTMEYLDAQNTVLLTNPRGFKARTVKDGLDRVYQSTVDDGGLSLTTTFTYDGNGNTKSVQDPQNADIDVMHDYDGLNRRLRSTFAATPSDTGVVKEELVYDGNGNLIRTIDKRGVEFYSTYDNLNRPLRHSVLEAISNGGQELVMMTQAYDDLASTLTVTDANGNVTVTRNDELGRPERIDDPDPGPGVSFLYDGVNKIAEIDKRGLRTEFRYDVINRLTATLEFDGTNTPRTSTSVRYEDALNRKVTTDRRGIETIAQSDALGRVVRLSRAHPDLTAFYGVNPVLLEIYEYDGNGNQTNIIDGVGNRIASTYDGADRKVTMTEGAGSTHAATTTYTYDKVNNLLTVKDGRAHGGLFDAKYTYDGRYRRITTENGALEATASRYDPNNNLVRMEEPLGPTYATEYRYDELNQLIAVDETPRDPTGVTAGVTRFFYDGNRNKIAQQDADGNLVTYRYDALNRLTNTLQHTVPGILADGTVRGPSPTNNPAGGDPTTALQLFFGYDLNGNQNVLIDARNQRVDLSFDWLDRLTNRSYSGHAESGLDFQPQAFAYEYDGNGNVERVRETKSLGAGNATEQSVMTYDPLDRLRTQARFDHDLTAGKTNLYAYDIQGNRRVITDPDGIRTDYVYDSRNRLAAVTNVAGVTFYEYWEDNLLKSCRYPNNTMCDRSDAASYDRADRALDIINRPVDTNLPPFSVYTYAYDANGNRTNQFEIQQALIGGTSERTAYSYDRLNRLQTVIYGANGSVSYTYAPNGNRLTEQGTDPVTSLPVNRRYHYETVAGNANTFDRVNVLSRIEDLANAAQTIDYHYDRNLNQTNRIQAGVSRSFRYDIRDQILQTVQAGDAVSFDYNHDRLRVKKISAASETRYLYDQSSVLVEYGGGASAHQTIHKYDYGYDLLSISRPLATLTNRESDFFLLDGLMSTANLTDTNGALKHSYLYDAWGRTRTNSGTSDNPRQYTGHYKDEETGLHYFGARYYDDETGRFLSQDPYLGDANTPPSLHRYLYAYANPTRFVDLTGYASEEVGFWRQQGIIAAGQAVAGVRRGFSQILGLASGGMLGNPTAGASPERMHEDMAIMEAAQRGDMSRALGIGAGVQRIIDEWETMRELGSDKGEAAAMMVANRTGVSKLGQAYARESLARKDLGTGMMIPGKTLSFWESVGLGLEGTMEVVNTVLLLKMTVEAPRIAYQTHLENQVKRTVEKVELQAALKSPAGFSGRTATPATVIEANTSLSVGTLTAVKTSADTQVAKALASPIARQESAASLKSTVVESLPAFETKTVVQKRSGWWKKIEPARGSENTMVVQSQPHLANPGMSCSAAVGCEILGSQGRSVAIEAFADMAHTSKKGTFLSKMFSAFESFGGSGTQLSPKSLSEFASRVSSEFPAATSVARGSGANRVGHSIAVYEVDFAGKRVLISDPLQGRGWVSMREFLRNWYPGNSIVTKPR